MIEGKTIARVINGEYSPWIVFTDGAGIELNGWEDGADYREVTADEIAKHEAELAKRELTAHRQAAYQESWMMRSCEERGEVRAQWLAGRPKPLLPNVFEGAFMDSMVWDMNRTAFGEQPKIKGRCPVCNERSCPNAPYMEAPNRGLVYQSGTITIPVKKAR